MEKDIVYLIIGILFLLFGIFSTIGCWREIKQEVTKEELKVIFYSILLNITISFACAGADLIINS